MPVRSKQKKVTDALATLELPVKRTVAECQRKLLKYQENIPKKCESANWNRSVIVFENFQGNWSFGNCWLKPMVRCMLIRWNQKCMVKSNRVGLQLSLDLLVSYKTAWPNIYCIAYLKESLVLGTNEGVSWVILDSNVIHHIGVNFKPNYIVPFTIYRLLPIYYCTYV